MPETTTANAAVARPYDVFREWRLIIVTSLFGRTVRQSMLDRHYNLDCIVYPAQYPRSRWTVSNAFLAVTLTSSLVSDVAKVSAATDSGELAPIRPRASTAHIRTLSFSSLVNRSRTGVDFFA